MGEILQHQQTPARHRLDVGAYYKMAEAGILTQDDRVELIDGEIFDMVPIGSAHAGKTDRLNWLFARAAARGPHRRSRMAGEFRGAARDPAIEAPIGPSSRDHQRGRQIRRRSAVTRVALDSKILIYAKVSSPEMQCH